MKLTASLLAAFGLLTSLVSVHAAPPPLALTFEQILALPKGQAVIYTPVHLKQGKSVGVHSFTNRTLALRPNGGARGVQVVLFAIKPDNSSVDAIAYDVIPTDAAGATGNGGGGGAGKVSMHDFHFNAAPGPYVAADGSVRFIVATIGYDVVRSGMPARPFPLPKELSLTVQLDDDGTKLLLPAIQAVR